MNSLNFEAIPHFSSNLSLSGLTWDLAAIVFVALIIFLFGITSGRDKLLALLLSLYAASAVARTSPGVVALFAEQGVRASPFTQLAAFIVFFLVFSFLLSGKIFVNIFKFSVRGLSSLWQVLVLSLLLSGLFVNLSLQFLPYNTVMVSPLVASFFRDGFAPLLWAAAPVLFLIFLRVEEE